ncbi:hypothetical protein OH492_21395 [Vibrio chagasii]|nr:hypothetical protein [Vibrio chagasii]
MAASINIDAIPEIQAMAWLQCLVERASRPWKTIECQLATTVLHHSTNTASAMPDLTSVGASEIRGRMSVPGKMT